MPPFCVPDENVWVLLPAVSSTALDAAGGVLLLCCCAVVDALEMAGAVLAGWGCAGAGGGNLTFQYL